MQSISSNQRGGASASIHTGDMMAANLDIYAGVGVLPTTATAHGQRATRKRSANVGAGDSQRAEGQNDVGPSHLQADREWEGRAGEVRITWHPSPFVL